MRLLITVFLTVFATVLFSSLATAQKAWEPGHYILGGINADNEADAIARIQASPQHWKGLAIWRDWNQIENAIQGQYDWSSVWSVVNKLKPLNKKLVVFLQEKGWGGIVTPAYMQNDPKYDGVNGEYVDGWYRDPNATAATAYYSAIWNPNVYARYIAWHQAFVDEFRNEPTVIMSLTSETAYPTGMWDLSDCSRPIMIDTLVSTVQTVTEMYSGSHILFARGANSNLFPDLVSQLCTNIDTYGACGTGPGAKPGAIQPMQSGCYIPMNNGVGSANDFCYAGMIQGPDYSSRPDGATRPLDETWAHITQTLNMNLVFWSHTTGDLFGIQDVQNKINGNPTRDIETIVPINLDVELPRLPFVPPVIDNVVIN